MKFFGFLQAEVHNMTATFRSSKTFLVFYVLLQNLLVAESSRGTNKAIRADDRLMDYHLIYWLLKNPLPLAAVSHPLVIFKPFFLEEIYGADTIPDSGLESIMSKRPTFVFKMLNTWYLKPHRTEKLMIEQFFEGFDEIAQYGGLMINTVSSVVLNEAG